MTSARQNRETLTKKILLSIKPGYTGEEFELAKKTWWTNIRKGGGFGLTSIGKEAFERAEIEYWDLSIKVGDIITPMAKLKLDRYLPCPYYLFIKLRKPNVGACIRIYSDSTVVIMSQLHGSFQTYLESLVDVSVQNEHIS